MLPALRSHTAFRQRQLNAAIIRAQAAVVCLDPDDRVSVARMKVACAKMKAAAKFHREAQEMEQRAIKEGAYESRVEYR